MSAAPIVYLFHGDDEFAIQSALNELQARSQEGSMGDMNIASLDGRTANLDTLRNVAYALPFLADRRLVIVTHALARFNRRSQPDDDGEGSEHAASRGGQKKERTDFLEFLESVPASTALVLVEYSLLDDADAAPAYSRKKIRDHWLIKWAKTHPEKVYIRAYAQPKGAAMTRWIQGRARELGGRISLEAAEELSDLLGSDTRTAENELQKLLAYTGYEREVDYEDVALLVADSSTTNIFDLVDAMGARNGREATRLLNRLMEVEDPLRLFGMVVRQYRLLLMALEVIQGGGGEKDIARLVRVHPFVAGKLNTQARRFSASDLQAIYRRLLEIDRGVKSSQIEMPIALNMLVAATAN
ncbi:MAG: DNA polymerase III subunit delta [Anaerolineales bacterium]